jgi:hypothetical protein
MNSAELDEYITRIENSLGPDPSDEEIVEATTTAYIALTEEERASIDLNQLRRRQAVYRSIEFE